MGHGDNTDEQFRRQNSQKIEQWLILVSLTRKVRARDLEQGRSEGQDVAKVLNQDQESTNKKIFETVRNTNIRFR